MSAQNQEELGRGPVLRPLECWSLIWAAEVAARLGAPEAVLMASRRGARLFSANDLWSPAWWISTTIRRPEAAGGHAAIAPPAAIVRALRGACALRGRGGTLLSYGAGAFHVVGPAAATEVHGRIIQFRAGSAIPVSEDEELDVDAEDLAAEARLHYLELAGTVNAMVAVTSPPRAVELRLVRSPGLLSEWWLEVAGDGLARRLPVEVRMLPERDAVVGRYPAAMLNALLSIPIWNDIAVEFAGPADLPALRVRWEERNRRTEFQLAPLG